MTALANDTDLKFASIDLSLYHVNTGILLQLWRVHRRFVSDGRRNSPCAQRRSIPDHAITRAAISRQCWKTSTMAELSYAAHGHAAIPLPAIITSIPPTAVRRTA